MRRAEEHVVGGSTLHDPAVGHDGDLVAHVRDDAEVVRDEQEAEAETALQLVEEVEHLGLHGDVEGGHGLVADEHVGAGREGARDGDALTLAAGEPRGTAGEERGIQAHLREERPGGVEGAGAAEAGYGEGVPQDPVDAPARVEGRERVLVDGADPRASAPARAFRDAAPRLAVERHVARVRLLERQQEAGDRGLARAGSPDEAERAAAADLEGDVVDGGARGSAVATVGAGQSGGAEDDAVVRAWLRGPCGCGCGVVGSGLSTGGSGDGSGSTGAGVVGSGVGTVGGSVVGSGWGSGSAGVVGSGFEGEPPPVPGFDGVPGFVPPPPLLPPPVPGVNVPVPGRVPGRDGMFGAFGTTGSAMRSGAAVASVRVTTVPGATRVPTDEVADPDTIEISDSRPVPDATDPANPLPISADGLVEMVDVTRMTGADAGDTLAASGFGIAFAGADPGCGRRRPWP